MAPSVVHTRMWSCKDFCEERCQQQAVDALTEQHGIFYSVVFAPADSMQGLQLLFAAHSSGRIRVIDWQATQTAWSDHKQQLGCTHSQWTAHSGAVYRLAVHPQAGLLISAGDDGLVRLWRLSHIAAATAAVASTSTDAAAPGAASSSCGSTAGGVAELDLSPVAELQLPHAPQQFPGGPSCQPAAQALKLDQTQGRAYIGASDGGCYMVDLQGMTASGSGQQPQPLSGHLAGVLDLDWCSPAQLLASGSEDGTLRLWDVRSGAAVKAMAPWAGAFLPPGDAQAALAALGEPAVCAMGFNPEGTFLVVASSNASLSLLDVRMDEVARQEHTDKSVPSALLLQPASIYMVGSAPQLHRYSFLLKPQERINLRSSSHCCSVALEGDSGMLAVGGSRGCLELVDAQGGLAGAVRVPDT